MLRLALGTGKMGDSWTSLVQTHSWSYVAHMRARTNSVRGHPEVGYDWLYRHSLHRLLRGSLPDSAALRPLHLRHYGQKWNSGGRADGRGRPFDTPVGKDAKS